MQTDKSLSPVCYSSKLKDVWFDYLYAADIFPVIAHFIENPARYKDYNICSGERVLISEIAEEVKQQMGPSAEIVFEKKGLNFEYTGSNARLLTEIPHWNPRPISESIREIIKAVTDS